MLFTINKMSSENDASLVPETIVSQSEEVVAASVTDPLVSPVSVPSSARLEVIQSAYQQGDRAGQESVQLVQPPALASKPPALPIRPSIIGQSPALAGQPPAGQTASSMSLQCAICDQLQGESDKLALSIQELVQGEELSMLNIIQICLSLMTMAEKVPHTTGPQRKQIVLQAVSTYLDKTGGDPNLVNLLPPFIDAAIALEKGDTQIATQDAVVGCFGCLTFCSEKNSKSGLNRKK